MRINADGAGSTQKKVSWELLPPIRHHEWVHLGQLTAYLLEANIYDYS